MALCTSPSCRNLAQLLYTSFCAYSCLASALAELFLHFPCGAPEKNGFLQCRFGLLFIRLSLCVILLGRWLENVHVIVDQTSELFELRPCVGGWGYCDVTMQ